MRTVELLRADPLLGVHGRRLGCGPAAFTALSESVMSTCTVYAYETHSMIMNTRALELGSQ